METNYNLNLDNNGYQSQNLKYITESRCVVSVKEFSLYQLKLKCTHFKQ